LNDEELVTITTQLNIVATLEHNEALLQYWSGTKACYNVGAQQSAIATLECKGFLQHWSIMKHCCNKYKENVATTNIKNSYKEEL
jgi:nitrous oxide reductase